MKISPEGQSHIYQFIENEYHGISSNLIYVITEDSQHRIWVGTDGGVNVLTPGNADENDFIYFDTRDGLPDNNVCGIVAG